MRPTVGGLLSRLALPLLLLLPSAAGAGESQRIASLNLTSDEVLVELVPPSRLVAVTAVADEPDSSNVAGRLPAGALRFRRADLERLVTLSPDLVVVSEYTDADFLALLERSGLHYHRMENLDSFVGIRRAIQNLGRAVGEPARAEALVARFDSVLSDLSRRVAGAGRPRVLYWSDPMTAGENTVISDAIEAAGGTNVGREMGVRGILPVGTERVFLAKPDYVLVGTAPGARQALVSDPLLSQLAAVREGRIIEMPNRLLVTLSQYAAETAWHLAHALHKERVPSPEP